MIIVSILRAIKREIAKFVFRKRRIGFYRDLGKAINTQDKLVVFLEENIKHLKEHGQNWQAELYEEMLFNLQKVGSLSGMLDGIVPDGDQYILQSIDKQAEDYNKYESLLWLSSTVKAMRVLIGEMIKAVSILFLIVPIIVTFLVVVSVKFVPLIEVNLPHEEWSTKGQILYLASYYVTHIEGLFVLLGIFIVSFLYYKSFGFWRGQTRNFFEKKISIINAPYVLYRDFLCATFLIGLASLLKTGVSLGESLSLLREKGNRFMQWHIDEIIERLPTAKKICDAFDTGLIAPPLFLQLSNAARTSDFDNALIHLANDGLEDVKAGINLASNSMRVSSVIGAAMVIGFLGLTVLDLVSEIQEKIESKSLISQSK